MRQLFLKKREDRRIRAGHLWVFSNEVDVARAPLTSFEPGEPVTLCDASGTPLGTGCVNPASLIAVRLLIRTPGEEPGADLLRKRLTDALDLRKRLFDAPCYRLCHSEGDFVPGLVVDRFGDILSVQLNTAGMERLRQTVLEVLTDLVRPSVIVLRNDTASRSLEGLPRETETVLGTLPDEVELVENGVTFRAPMAPEQGGQKTGWFYDQRFNRLEAARHAGPRVLDAFCYAGGFGVMAARGGAREVTFLDASSAALDAAGANLHRTAPEAGVERLHGDALTLLAELRDAGRRFDLVCLDPPAFIKRRKDAAQGLAAYRRVNDLGLQLLEDGGTLITCSCSHHLETDTLQHLLTQSLARRGLFGQLVRKGYQGPDHPVHPAMPETAYLKALTLRVRRA
ncbi:MAG TPA: class I SAM-dependent rRNA methyltransferase [Candidatus Avidesulfovibrio excrementigallinarum]|nr:class I SAM-dependent rRNA methyltransferase [Candidatus Avidesulfovibrio excrementigallinarum]